MLGYFFNLKAELRRLNNTEWHLRGEIENALNVEGTILSIHYNAQFIPDFQCVLQAFSLCFLATLSLMVWP